MNSNQQTAFDSIVQVWKGGERKLAGARASELIYGASSKPNQAILVAFLEEVPELKDYISAPVSGTVIDTVRDSGYEAETTPSNLSSDQAKDEQDAIDATLKPGHDAREKRRETGDDTVGDTQLNPPEDPRDPLDHDHNGVRGGHFDNRGKSGKK